MPETKTFRAILEKDDQTSGTGVAMPFDVEKAFGTRGRVPVRGTINGFAFRSTLAPYGGRHYLPVNKALREGAGAQAGDRVEITLERDQEERVVTAPPDLVKALRANKAAQAAWDRLSYTHRREYVESIEEAKKPETRLRRLGGAVEALAAARRGKR